MNATKAQPPEIERTIPNTCETPSVPSRPLEAPPVHSGPISGPLNDPKDAPVHPPTDPVHPPADPLDVARKALAGSAHALMLAGRYDDARVILDTIARIGARAEVPVDVAPVVELDSRRK